MEQFRKDPAAETRLTQAELALLLNRWRDEQENTVSVQDVAEALHCSKAEIEALVWRARAERQTPVHRASRNYLRSIMVGVLIVGVIAFLTSVSMGYPGNQGPQMYAAFCLALWALYATFTVLAQALSGKD